MLQALINFFNLLKQEPVQVKVEDTVKAEASVIEPVVEAPVVEAKPVPKVPNKGCPKTNKPATAKATAKTPRIKK
jgi:hypothetical protein